MPAHGKLLQPIERNRPDSAQQLRLLVAHGVGLETRRWFHGDQTEHLQNVVLNHVADHSCLLVISAAVLYTQRFRHDDLHVVDVAAVPDGLEDAVREPQHEKILDGFPSQIVVDAVDFLLLESAFDHLVELARALAIAPEGLFDDDARPVFFRIPRAAQACRSQVLDDGGKGVGRSGQIIEPVTASRTVTVNLVQSLVQLRVRGGVAEVVGDIEKQLRKFTQLRFVHFAGHRLADRPAGPIAELLVAVGCVRTSDHRETLRQ